MKFVTSCRTNSKRGSRMWAILSIEPVRRLSMQTISQPRASRKSQRWEPMKPAPPVTSTRTAPSSDGQDGLSPDRVVLEAEAPHALRLVEVPPVENERAAHQAPQPLQIEKPELVPLGDQGDRVRPLGGIIGRLAEGDAGGQEPLGIAIGHRIVGADARARRLELADDLEALGVAHVVGIRLEREPQDGDRLVIQRPQRLA